MTHIVNNVMIGLTSFQMLFTITKLFLSVFNTVIMMWVLLHIEVEVNQVTFVNQHKHYTRRNKLEPNTKKLSHFKEIKIKTH